MNDAILSPNHRKEALSRAYVSGVAAGAGYTFGPPDFDLDGVDVQVRAGGKMRPMLDIQLKATTRLKPVGKDKLHYPLRRRNYDLLIEKTMVPRVLVVLDLPQDEKQWISTSPEELVMRRSAYWACIKGLAKTTNKKTVTIEIRKQDRFDIEGLKNLMNRARQGVL